MSLLSFNVFTHICNCKVFRLEGLGCHKDRTTVQAPCGIASDIGKTWKYSTNLHNPRLYTCASFDVSLTIQNMQFYRANQTVLHIDRSLLGCCGQFCRSL